MALLKLALVLDTQTSVLAMAEAGTLWCPAVYCDGALKQPLHPTEHDPSLYRCSCCGTDWSLVALAAQYRAMTEEA